MGSAASYEVKPQELAEFRKLKVSGRIEELDIPQRPENRVVTNKKWLLLYIFMIVVLIPCLIYGFVCADLRRLTHHYDPCGNLCGYNNSYVKPFTCSGKNMANKPYLQFQYKANWRNRECVASCSESNFDIMNYKCFPSEHTTARSRSSSIDVWGHFSNDLNISSWRIVLGIFISIGVCLVFLLLFRFAVVPLVWTILIGTILLFAALCGVCCYFTVKTNAAKIAKYDNEVDSLTKAFAFFAAITGVFAVVLLILVICMRKRIRLVTQIMKEATKAIFSCPSVILVPIVVTILQNLILIALIVGTLALLTSGKLEEVSPGLMEYTLKAFGKFTLGFNIVIAIWSLNFIFGCEHMIIAGVVASWYFTKNKHTLSSPVLRSIYVTLRFHLGTIAIGTLIITIVSILRAIIRGLMSNKIARAVVDFCMRSLEVFLKYLTKNAYIMTAIHGQSFYRSGKRAAKLLMANAVDVVAINSVGDYVLGITSVLVVIIATAVNSLLFLSLDLEYRFAPMLIIFVLTAFIVSCFFQLFETAIDTIFLCFCEDCNINDGMARPYYMSRAMFEFMTDSKAIMGEKKK